jgi:SAM-dependent methyltransferase
MFNKIAKYLERPGLYEESSSKFWDDEHISKGMLEAHLDPLWDAASRNHSFMDKSAQWIYEIAPSKKYNKLLDLGCGPGLYAERLYEKGYCVTGIDFSRRSIEYGKREAKVKNNNIVYIYKNYLEIEYDNCFDLVTLIYCDFEVLSNPQREMLLRKVYCALKDGGKFIFDVFTPKQYEGRSENNTWHCYKEGGYWRPIPHLCIQSHYIYDNNIRLEQYVIVDSMDKIDVYRIWDHYYTKAEIMAELSKAGFSNIEFYSDVSGTPYDEESKTMCIVAAK